MQAYPEDVARPAVLSCLLARGSALMLSDGGTQARPGTTSVLAGLGSFLLGLLCAVLELLRQSPPEGALTPVLSAWQSELCFSPC